MKRGFTLLEILIVISLIAILATAAIYLIDPIKQFYKAWDGQRKNDLATTKKVLEDFYNDKSRYPKASEICYDAPSSARWDNYGKLACFCHLCGSKTTSPLLSPYLSKLPCDPQSPSRQFLYDFDCQDGGSRPQWFRIYTNLSLSTIYYNDPATEEVACHNNGCGPAPDYGYSYGVNGPSVDLERSVTYAFCSHSGCNVCGLFDECLAHPIEDFCQETKRVYPAGSACASSCPCQ